MNPTHKQKKSKEPDAPQWYIDAWQEMLRNGIGLVVFRNDEEPTQIPPEKYLDMAEILMAKYQEIKGIPKP